MDKTNYYKYALKEVLNILIISALLIAGIVGFYKVALIFLVIEIAYLLIIPNNNTYKKYIDLKNNQSSDNGLFKESQKNFFNLPNPLREKCEQLQKKYNQIIKKVSKNKNLGFAFQDQINNLDFLIDKYISFSETYLSYQDYLNENSYESINKEINETKNKIKNNFTDIKVSNDLDAIHNRMKNKTILKNNLEILEKRLNKIKEISNLSDTLKAQIDHIEDSFYLVSDYLMTSDSVDTDFDVNKIIKDVEITESTIKATQKEINKLNNIKFDYN